MLVIRLSRVGKKNSPSYRLVVADKKRAVKGKYLESLGHYNPISQPKEFVADKEKILAYVKNGAQISVTALNLLCDNGILPKNKKIKVVHAKKKVEESKDSDIPTESVGKLTTEDKPKTEDKSDTVEVATEETVKEETPTTEVADAQEIVESPEAEESAVAEETSEEAPESAEAAEEEAAEAEVK